MPRYFTHYWTNQTWDEAQAREQELLDHTASNIFRKRGIQADDYVYVVTVRVGLLYLLGVMLVGEVCAVDTAAKRLNTSVAELWDATDHLIAQQATPMNFNQPIPDQVARVLRFKSGADQKPLFFRPNGHIDQQTLRGVRELTPASAQQLAHYHGQLQVLATSTTMPNQGAQKMVTTPPKHTLKAYYQSINDEFQSTKDRIRSLLGSQKHWLTDGEHKEAILRKTLRQHVPEVMRIGTGFVSFPSARTSNQQDILITDIRKPTLFKDHDLTIVTPDAVRALIEVKTSQTNAQLTETLTKLANNIENVRVNSDAYEDNYCFAGLFVYEDSGLNPENDS